MSIKNDLRIRLGIQRGDELIYVSKLYDEHLYFLDTYVGNRKLYKFIINTQKRIGFPFRSSYSLCNIR